jgi:hypothetical protein
MRQNPQNTLAKSRSFVLFKDIGPAQAPALAPCPVKCLEVTIEGLT